MTGKKAEESCHLKPVNQIGGQNCTDFRWLKEVREARERGSTGLKVISGGHTAQDMKSAS